MWTEIEVIYKYILVYLYKKYIGVDGIWMLLKHLWKIMFKKELIEWDR